jgi:hypothetical protein
MTTYNTADAFTVLDENKTIQGYTVGPVYLAEEEISELIAGPVIWIQVRSMERSAPPYYSSALTIPFDHERFTFWLIARDISEEVVQTLHTAYIKFYPSVFASPAYFSSPRAYRLINSKPYEVSPTNPLSFSIATAPLPVEVTDPEKAKALGLKAVSSSFSSDEISRAILSSAGVPSPIIARPSPRQNEPLSTQQIKAVISSLEQKTATTKRVFRFLSK